MAIDKKPIDQLLTDYKKPEDIIGENGLLKQLTKAVLERALGAEMTEHLGADAHRRSSRQPHRGATALESRRQRAAHQRNPSLREDGACAYADLPHIATLIADGEITVGILNPVGGVAVATDDHNTLAMLKGRPGETLRQLLTRLDQAIERAWTEQT